VLLIPLVITAALACTRPLPAGHGLAPTAVAATPAAATLQAIERATRDYVESHSPVRDFTVEVQAVAGDYARAKVTPPPGVTDPAWVFVLRTGGQWAGLTIGTAFPPQTYDLLGIPPAVQLPGGIATLTPAPTPSPSGRG